MRNTSLNIILASMFTIAIVASPALTNTTYAATTIKQTHITEQTEAVEASLVETLEEYVKLLQMSLIVKLQERLAQLQAQ